MAVPIARGVGPPPLLALLADGAVHSGERLAADLNLSRAAVWKAVGRLRSLGIDVQSLPRRGYRLAQPVELLDAQRIIGALASEHAARIESLELPFEIDSTNSRLAAAVPPPFGRLRVCLGELQTAGRGRRGRSWLAPFGSGVAMSLGWSVSEAARVGPSLSLGVGVAVAGALERCGAGGIRLKWPNDIWHEDRKIGGILVELKAEAGGPAYVVIGIGINVRLTDSARRQIAATGTVAGAVADACREPPSRNAVAAAVLGEVVRMLDTYEREGFPALARRWSGLDALAGRAASLQIGAEVFAGIARGVDTDGALLLEGAGGTRRFVSGEASLRLAAGVA